LIAALEFIPGLPTVSGIALLQAVEVVIVLMSQVGYASGDSMAMHLIQRYSITRLSLTGFHQTLQEMQSSGRRSSGRASMAL